MIRGHFIIPQSLKMFDVVEFVNLKASMRSFDPAEENVSGIQEDWKGSLLALIHCCITPWFRPHISFDDGSCTTKQLPVPHGVEHAEEDAEAL